MRKKSLFFILPVIIILIGIVLYIFSKEDATQQLTRCPQHISGINYLNNQYNPKVGLLSEAPHVAPNTYWITNDNVLAAYTLSQFGETEISDAINHSLAKYDNTHNGFVEIIFGEGIPHPPHVASVEIAEKTEEFEVLNELHYTGPQFLDWAEYANLGFVVALNYYHQGNPNVAKQIFERTMKLYDGIGFKDKAFSDQYETYKLALALYTGNTLNTDIPFEKEIESTLVKMQAESGGFHTHYDESLVPQGDTNTETTALALLAIKNLSCNE